MDYETDLTGESWQTLARERTLVDQVKALIREKSRRRFMVSCPEIWKFGTVFSKTVIETLNAFLLHVNAPLHTRCLPVCITLL